MTKEQEKIFLQRLEAIQKQTEDILRKLTKVESMIDKLIERGS